MRLILAFLCLCIPMNGYIMRIFRGANPAPEIDNWGALFVDGIKLMALWIVYMIPICVITYVLLSVGFSLDIMRIIVIIYVFFYLLIMPTSSINLARSNSFYEGLNFRSIIGHIGRIGWINNIIAFIILAVDLFILYIIIRFCALWLDLILFYMFKDIIIVSLGGFFLSIIYVIIVAPLFIVYMARYVTQIYDSVQHV